MTATPQPQPQPTKKKQKLRTLGTLVDRLGPMLDARRTAATILEVLAGVRTTTDATKALGICLPRYYAIEARAVEAFVRACAPTKRGPGASPARELEALRKEKAKLERECARQTTLARATRRALGLELASPEKPKPASDPKGKEKPATRKGRRPTARALVAAKAIALETVASAEKKIAAALAPRSAP
jgi:hypothetical protein